MDKRQVPFWLATISLFAALIMPTLQGIWLWDTILILQNIR
jgi:hypothetical protein